ncbi:uberolysin/carnocyclin family circular bacteriocin [Clostridium estertheticum]|uniref:uberolysin/carnocyclin family circular bacteriocin n=1 Tax=Clostridium estertheticum TaxID=238834 RepID=UPI00192E2AD6|nr:uberolysin/carnocyclin family circular bacteriocin [Clostridium estertheticum]MBZ9609941.1 uberolysin/carnocyclin family circular bacteriocin [Clostridium estertheticum]
MFDICGMFADKIKESTATQIVNIIDAYGYAAIAVTLIMTVLSAGGLSASSVAIDGAIVSVKQFLKKNLKGQAIAF